MGTIGMVGLAGLALLVLRCIASTDIVPLPSSGPLFVLNEDPCVLEQLVYEQGARDIDSGYMWFELAPEELSRVLQCAMTEGEPVSSIEASQTCAHRFEPSWFEPHWDAALAQDIAVDGKTLRLCFVAPYLVSLPLR